MFDVALIQQCADPGIEPAVVERFIAAVGADNPLAISITSGNRIILPEPPRTEGEAMHLLQRFVGKAVVRVGVTQYPAGVGITDIAELSADLVDTCGNIAMGSALFGKVYRIVAHSDGMSNGTVFDEAVEAWRTGSFEGKSVFTEADPGPIPIEGAEAAAGNDKGENAPATEPIDPEIEDDPVAAPFSGEDPNTAAIRIDLTGIGGEPFE